MDIEEVLAILAEENPEAWILPKKYHPALLGIGRSFNKKSIVVYSVEKIIEILMKDGISRDKAY